MQNLKLTCDGCGNEIAASQNETPTFYVVRWTPAKLTDQRSYRDGNGHGDNLPSAAKQSAGRTLEREFCLECVRTQSMRSLMA